MAEQSTLDFTQLEGVTPITLEIEAVENKSLPITNQLDFSKLEGVTPVTSQQTSTLDFSKLEGVTSVKETEPQITSTRQYTDAEKIRYGMINKIHSLVMFIVLLKQVLKQPLTLIEILKIILNIILIKNKKN
jgi:hypothetical protein